MDVQNQWPSCSRGVHFDRGEARRGGNVSNVRKIEFPCRQSRLRRRGAHTARAPLAPFAFALTHFQSFKFEREPRNTKFEVLKCTPNGCGGAARRRRAPSCRSDAGVYALTCRQWAALGEQCAAAVHVRGGGRRVASGPQGAPTRPPARAVEPAAAQPSAPRANRRPRLLLPALGVALTRASAAPTLCPCLRATLAMRRRRGTAWLRTRRRANVVMQYATHCIAKNRYNRRKALQFVLV
ncbi:hypothetical protein ACJJTC_013023 [Scirpophaga incertulas]